MTDSINNGGIDFSGAGDQQSREIIAQSTLVAVCMAVIPGGAGPDGALRRSKAGDTFGLNSKSVIISGPYKGRAIYQWFTVSGTTENQKEAAVISAATLRAILESARGVAPDPTKSKPEWLNAMHTRGYMDFHGLCFLVKVGVSPPKDNYPAKNTLGTIVTPNMPEYFRVDPVPVAAPASAAPAASASSGQTVIPLPAPSAPTERPSWAK